MENTSICLSDNLKSYFENKFILKETHKELFREDSSAMYWEQFLEKSSGETFEIIRKFYPQLYFQIEYGIDKSQDYINLVLKGKPLTDLKITLNLNAPKEISVKIYNSVYGKIPVIIIPDEEDFRTVIQSLLHKNNPVPVSLAMGAVLIKGINNWSRIHDLKNNWLKNNPFGDWNSEFSLNIIPNHTLYKDRIIILSTKPYSNVSADKLGISEKDWNLFSLSIRLEHECTHLYTLKKYGCASNNLHDELIADYIGITKTYGSYNKVWMLQFMGLEEYPKYRTGARLENYFPKSEFSEKDFKELIFYIKNAIENISAFDIIVGKIKSPADQICRIQSLCETNLIQLSSENGLNLITERYNRLYAQNENN